MKHHAKMKAHGITQLGEKTFALTNIVIGKQRQRFLKPSPHDGCATIACYVILELLQLPLWNISSVGKQKIPIIGYIHVVQIPSGEMTPRPTTLARTSL